MWIMATMAVGCPVLLCAGADGALGALNPRLDLWVWEPTGYLDWRKPGLARKQLALAVLAYSTNHTDAALHLCEAFDEEALSTLDVDGFTLCTMDVLTWCIHYLVDELTGTENTRRWDFRDPEDVNGK